MHILLVNDDGIGAKGIMALLNAACKRGHSVTMCAPRDPQSAMSHRITLTEPIFVKEYPLSCSNAKAWSIAGSPTDCVRLGLQEFCSQPVDLLLSGINNGYNAGMATHYSGTVGAAMEGVLNHLPSIASSIHHRADAAMLEHLAEITLAIAEKYVERAPKDALLNLNAPNLPPEQLKPLIYAPLCTANYSDKYERRSSPRSGDYYWLMNGCEQEPFLPGTDQYYLEEGHMTATLLSHPLCLAQEAWRALGI